MVQQSVLQNPHIKSVSKQRPDFEVADIFRNFGEEYRSKNRLPGSHLKVMRAIEACRTAELGGHVEECDNKDCDFTRIAYNSCRNRHCPKCQTLTKVKWLQDRQAELLPVAYYHAVFTLPRELNPLVLSNKKVLLDMLFKAVSETLKAFGKDKKNGLQGELGFTAILHTWSQTLMDHFHLHVVIPAGALSFDRQKWIPAKENFLFPVRALSIVFRAKFINYLKQAFVKGELNFAGKTADLKTKKGFHKFLKQLRRKNWVVYCKRPFKTPEHVFEYLGRYTHRVAISNHRILDIEDGKVTFLYKDRQDKNRTKQITLTAFEFIRRFLLHVIPDGFMRIRHYGFLANRNKKEKIMSIRKLLGISQEIPEATSISIEEMMQKLTGVDIKKCPQCKQGTLVITRKIERQSFKTGKESVMNSNYIDSS